MNNQIGFLVFDLTKTKEGWLEGVERYSELVVTPRIKRATGRCWNVPGLS